jgi:hypothetical protein
MGDTTQFRVLNFDCPNATVLRPKGRFVHYPTERLQRP